MYSDPSLASQTQFFSFVCMGIPHKRKNESGSRDYSDPTMAYIPFGFFHYHHHHHFIISFQTEKPVSVAHRWQVAGSITEPNYPDHMNESQ